MTSFRLLIAGVNDVITNANQPNSDPTPTNNKRTRKQQQKQQQQENKRRKLALVAVVDAALSAESEGVEQKHQERGVEDGEIVSPVGENEVIGDGIEDAAIEEADEEIGEEKVEIEDGEDGEDDEEEEDEVECDDFMKQLVDLQDLDAEQLRRIIQAEEAKELANKSSAI
jgi:hypothetical protein